MHPVISRNTLTLKHRSLLFFIMVLFCPLLAQASHIYGADFSYSHVSGNTYQVSLVVYGDCKGISFPSLASSRPVVQIHNGTRFVDSFVLRLQGAGVEVTPVCAAEKANTTCVNPGNPIPGVTRFIYTGTYTLPGTSANWVFRFDGNMGGALAGRSGLITNLTNLSVSTTALEAKLNNLAGPNSSPTFTTLPTPFYCVNLAQQFNLGAVDPDGDQLSFALVPGLNGQVGGGLGGGTVTYVAGYSATSPLSVVSGSFSFSPSTGQMSFTPNMIQTSLVVVEVQEVRNNVVVGTSSREMTFIVIASCNTTPASNMIDTALSSVHGGLRTGLNSFTVCSGTDSISFSIHANNPGNNTIDASYAGLPTGAAMNITGNGGSNPVLDFNWRGIPKTTGKYTFYVTYHDGGCPLASIQTTAYTIEVVNPNSVTPQATSPTNCYHQAAVDIRLADGLLPRNVEILRGGLVVKQFVDNTGLYTDSLEAGQYILHVTSPGLACATDVTFNVRNSGVYPVRPLVPDVFYCKQALAGALSGTADSGATLRWYDAAGGALGAAPTPRTDTAGIFTWYVSQQRDVCESLRDTVHAYVTPRPVASFTIAPTPICLNDTATIQFTGNVGVGPILDYAWTLDGGVAQPDTGAGPLRVYWRTKGNRQLVLQVSENRCSSLPYRDSILVKPVPFAAIAAPDRICRNEAAAVVFNGRAAADMNFSWQFTGNTLGDRSGAGPLAVSWQDTGLQTISLRIDQAGCADSRSREIYVDPLPDARILNIPEPVCIGQVLHLRAAWQPGNTYVWSRSSARFPEPGDTSFTVQLVQPERFQLQVANAAGCSDSSFQDWPEVQPCCNFSYPNAFTPNADGRNDVFKVIAYGNQLRFQLSIYNRWGQRVFYTNKAADGWDGTFNGKPCEAGSYYYVVEARCFTGYEEFHKGDLILVR